MKKFLIVFLLPVAMCLLPILSFAQTGIKVSELPAATVVNLNDLLLLSQGANSKKLTVQKLLDSLKNKIKKSGLTISGLWVFTANDTSNGTWTFNNIATFNGPIKLPGAEDLSAKGFGAPALRELRFEGDSVIYYYDPERGLRYLQTRDAPGGTGGGGSGKVDSTIVPYIHSPLADNEVQWALGADGFPYFIINFNQAYQYTGQDSLPTIAKIRSMAYLLNANHFKITGENAPYTVDLRDSIFQSITSETKSPASGSELSYSANLVKLDPSANINYTSLSTTMTYPHEVIIYNYSNSHTVTFTEDVDLKLSSATVVLGFGDVIRLIYDSGVWIQSGGSDN